MKDAGFSPDLPIFDFHQAIIDAVDVNQVTILTAETGAGKSTQVPQYLAEHGYSKIIVTQPRILAARNLSNRVREEWATRTGKDSDNVIGYRTAHERDDSPDTKILYCTDGLQLVREITGAGTRDKQVLILDEVHEWNENMEVLIAWAKKRCEEEPRFKVVIMSATIETGSLAEYFETNAVINVPGRLYDVTWSRGQDVLNEIFTRLGSKSNILVFLPGKAEIQATADAIKVKAEDAGVPVIPLHSQLEATAQQQAFASYPNGKIILATNIAQTSVTIDDIDVVIDSGLERRSEVRDGVEGLFIAQTSQADCLQRAGRAGRTKPGEYVLAQYDVLPCLDFEERPEYGTPEILRKHIDRLALRLANVGIDIETLDFYHDPSHKAIVRAKRTLVSLGALTKNGDVTGIGRQMEQFPVASSYARMLVESEKYEKSTQAKLAAIIGIQEVGGIIKGGTRYTGWRKYTKQTKSDLLAQYDILLELPNILPDEYEDLGIISKNVIKAQEVMERLNSDLGLADLPLTPVTQDEQSALMRCIVAGQTHQLWIINNNGEAEHLITRKRRELSSSTVVRYPSIFTGTPFDLQIPTYKGDLETLNLVQGITAVDTDWLLELAPDLFASRRSKIYYDPRLGGLAERQLVRFGGQVIEGDSTPVIDNSSENQKLFVESFAKWAYEQLERERRSLNQHYSRRLPSISLRQLQQDVKSMYGGVISLDAMNSDQKRRLTDLARLDTHLGEGTMQKIAEKSRRNDKPRFGRRFRRPHIKRKFDKHKR